MKILFHKIHFFLAIAVLLTCVAGSYAGDRAYDTIYPVVREPAPGLENYTVYRPANLTNAFKDRLPIVIWSGGGCRDANDAYQYFLSQIAMHGFVIVAQGPMNAHTGADGICSFERMPAAIDWATSAPGKGGPAYFNQLDASKIAVMGTSCGGIDALLTGATDSRVKSIVNLNSGYSTTPGMSGPESARRDLLPFLKGPILFINGGSADKAGANSLANYNLVNNVPAAIAIDGNLGHKWLYEEGEAPNSSGLPVARYVDLKEKQQAIRAVVEWLDATINGNNDALQWVIGPNGLNGQLASTNPAIYWTVQSKGF